MTSLFGLWLLVAQAPAPLSACPPTALPPGAHPLGEGAAKVYVPKSPMPPRGYATLIVLPRASSDAAAFVTATRLAELAEREAFVLVITARATSPSDDTSEVRALLAALGEQVCMDHERVYVVGDGDGGGAAERIACDLADRITAVASVAGTLEDGRPCKPQRRIAVLHVHGVDDQCDPIGGGVAGGTGGGAGGTPIKRRPLDERMSAWRERNGCGQRMRVVRRIGSTTCRVFDGCPDAADVGLCLVKEQAHGWPGARLDGALDHAAVKAPAPSCGEDRSSDFNAGEFIWSFLRERRLGQPTNVGRSIVVPGN